MAAACHGHIHQIALVIQCAAIVRRELAAFDKRNNDALKFQALDTGDVREDERCAFSFPGIQLFVGKFQRIDVAEEGGCAVEIQGRLLQSFEMGNGMIDTIEEVVFVDPATFDKSKTVEMAEEIDKINQEMGKAGKKYILIGPGRWGTRDRWIGVPVTWPQISNAKVIVETSLEGFPL